MIVKEVKIVLKKVFGHRYTPLIQDYFRKYGITNGDGTEISQVMIRQVLNGYKESPKIEEGIIKAAKEHKEFLKSLEQKEREKHINIIKDLED